MELKNYIQEQFRANFLPLLLEGKNRDIILNKIGLPTEISDWIETRFPEKYALWIANTFKNEAVNKIAGENQVLKNQIKAKFIGDLSQPAIKNALKSYKNYYDGAFREISDWLRGRRELAPENDQINLKELSFEEAKRRATIWHNEVAKMAGGKIEDEQGKVILTFSDGFYWLDLKTRNCSKEAKAMGHCGTATGNLYSLRKNKYPYLTADVNHGELVQLRGRSNTKPKSDLHKYIVEFLINNEIGINRLNPSTYKPEQNFMLADLDVANIEKVYNAKSNLFKSKDIYQCLMKYPSLINVFIGFNQLLDSAQKKNLIEIHPELSDRLN